MSIFAKRHYEIIATAMQKAHYGLDNADPGTRAATQSIRDELVKAFARDNANFQRSRFIAASIRDQNGLVPSDDN